MSGCKPGYYSFFSPRSCFSALAGMVRKTPSACILTSAPPCRAGRPCSVLTTLLTPAPAAACHRTPAAVGTRGRRAGVAAEGAEGRGAGAGGRRRPPRRSPASLPVPGPLPTRPRPRATAVRLASRGATSRTRHRGPGSRAPPEPVRQRRGPRVSLGSSRATARGARPAGGQELAV